jgi:hypothetical protein
MVGVILGLFRGEGDEGSRVRPRRRRGEREGFGCMLLLLCVSMRSLQREVEGNVDGILSSIAACAASRN